MNATFRIGAEWLARNHGDPIACATLAQVQIVVADRLLTRLEDVRAQTTRQKANLSAYDLALWLACNWWRLRWEPERKSVDWMMSHGLASIGGGYVWPDLTLISDGESIEFKGFPTSGSSCEPIRYLEDADIRIPAKEFERGVDDFIGDVLARLTALNLGDTELSDIWSGTLSERRDPAVALVSRLEALLGYDHGEAQQDELGSLVRAAERDGIDAVDEVAAYAGPNTGNVLSNVKRDIERAGIPLAADKIAFFPNLQDSCTGTAPWQRAHAAAQELRKEKRLKPDETATDEMLLELVGAQNRDFLQPSEENVTIAAAARPSNLGEDWRVVLHSKFETGRRFELCRIIADAILAPPTDMYLPVTRTRTARQKFQRAFAQELLCPAETILQSMNFWPIESEDIEQQARHFRVSDAVVRTILVNNDRLPREELLR